MLTAGPLVTKRSLSAAAAAGAGAAGAAAGAPKRSSMMLLHSSYCQLTSHLRQLMRAPYDSNFFSSIE